MNISKFQQITIISKLKLIVKLLNKIWQP